MRASFSHLQLAMLTLLAVASTAFAGEKVAYEGQTVIAEIQGVGSLSAKAGTVVLFSDTKNGVPDMISFEEPKGKVQGKYLLDDKGKPQNSGRVFYEGASMPYLVVGTKEIYTYHLKYLELTTVFDKHGVFFAYVTKAVASDNTVEIVESKNEKKGAFDMPAGGELVVDHGLVKFGDNFVRSDYELSGKVVDPPVADKTGVRDVSPTSQKAGSSTQPTH